MGRSAGKKPASAAAESYHQRFGILGVSQVEGLERGFEFSFKREDGTGIKSPFKRHSQMLGGNDFDGGNWAESQLSVVRKRES